MCKCIHSNSKMTMNRFDTSAATSRHPSFPFFLPSPISSDRLVSSPFSTLSAITRAVAETAAVIIANSNVETDFLHH